MMEVRNVSYSYGKKPALRNVSLSFEPGKLYAVIGPNGSGKTTLIKLLSRQIQPKDGVCLLDGKLYSGFDRKTFARQTALLPQGRNTPNLSALELVSCGRYPYLGLSRKLTDADREAVRQAMAVTGAAPFAGRNVKTLSGGERQRVYMAMLYAQDTPYVLLDEPNTHLDMGGSFQVMEQLAHMKRSGKCVIAVLHDLSLALQYADVVILAEKGEIRMTAEPAEMVKQQLLRSVFRVECTPVMVNGKTEYVFSPIGSSPVL